MALRLNSHWDPRLLCCLALSFSSTAWSLPGPPCFPCTSPCFPCFIKCSLRPLAPSWIWWPPRPLQPPLPLQINNLSWKLLIPVSKRGGSVWGCSSCQYSHFRGCWPGQHLEWLPWGHELPQVQLADQGRKQVHLSQKLTAEIGPFGKALALAVGWWGWAPRIRRSDTWSSFCFSMAELPLQMSLLLISFKSEHTVCAP